MSKPPPRLLLRSIPRKAAKTASSSATAIPQAHTGSLTLSGSSSPSPLLLSQSPLYGPPLPPTSSAARTSGLHTSSSPSTSMSTPQTLAGGGVGFGPITYPHWLASQLAPIQHTVPAPLHTPIAWPQAGPAYTFQRHGAAADNALDYPLAPAHAAVAELSSLSLPAQISGTDEMMLEQAHSRGRELVVNISSDSSDRRRRRSGQKSRSPSRSNRRGSSDQAPEAAHVTAMLDGFMAAPNAAVDIVGVQDSAWRRSRSTVAAAASSAHRQLSNEAAALSGAHDDPEDLVTRTPSPGSITHAAGGLRFMPGAHGIPKKRHQDAASLSTKSGSANGADDSSQDHFLRILEEFDDGLEKRGESSFSSSAVQVGEDAYFFRSEALGIADGVGGWTSARARSYAAAGGGSAADDDEATIAERARRARADPGLFSRLLMHYCEREVDAWKRGDPAWLVEGASNGVSDGERPQRSKDGLSMSFSGGDQGGAREDVADGRDDLLRRPLDPVEVMQKAYERCMDAVQHEGIFGSATCLLAVLTHDELAVANMGDCAIAVVRQGEIVFRTQEMQHSFNFPIQLGTNSRDEPMKDAELSRYHVKRGDIVVMCTDGLVDNLFDEDILEVIATFAPPLSAPPASSRVPTPAGLPPFSPRKVSEALCRAAQVASEETAGASPFMCRAIEEGIDFLGGKKDDISVLVAVVQAES